MGGSSRGRAALGCRANLSFAAFFYAWRDLDFDSCCTFVLYRAQAGEQMSCSLLVYSGLPPNFRRQSVTADPWPAGGVGRLGGLAAEIALSLAEQCGHPWTWEDIRLARLL